MTQNQATYYHQQSYIVEQLCNIVHNIDQIIVAYFNDDTKNIQALQTAPNKDFKWIQFPEDFNYYHLERLRKGGSKFFWTDHQSLPFNLESKRIGKQKEVFEESDNAVLVCKLQNEHDHLNDLFILYFRPDATNFSIAKKDDVLSTQAKQIIAHLCQQNILQLQNQFKVFQKQNESYQKYLAQLRDALNFTKAEFQKHKETTGNQKLDIAKFLIQKVIPQSTYDITFSREAEDKIKDFDGSMSQFEHWLKAAAEFALFSNVGKNLPLISIEEWHLQRVEKQKNTKLEEYNELTDSKFQKTFSLLNRLESAAQKVLISNKKLTGSMVGMAMDQPISAPAITDALKKHGHKIVYLMQKYPQKWNILRAQFRPVMNVIDSPLFNKSRTA